MQGGEVATERQMALHSVAQQLYIPMLASTRYSPAGRRGALFCLCVQAMENSIAKDYVSEKVYHALVAGCVPIYWGAPNIEDYVPTLEALINYAQLDDPAALKAVLEDLATNQTAYEAKLLWKQQSLTQMSRGANRPYRQGTMQRGAGTHDV